MSQTVSDYKTISIENLKCKQGTIKFDAPIKIDFLIYTKEQRIEYIYDFGYSSKFEYYSKNLMSETVLIEYFKEFITSELAKTFFFPQEREEYSLLNWALYGNLKNRAIVKHTF